MFMNARRSFLATALLAGGAFVSGPLIGIAGSGSPSDTVPAGRPILPPEPECCLWACWLGHSTVLLNLSGTWILTDPVLFPTYGLSVLGLTLGPRRVSPPALTVEELPRPDIVLLSHAHLDHMDRRTLIALTERWNGQLDLVTAMNTSDVIDDLPWRSISEMDWEDSVDMRGVRIEGLRVRHNGWRLPGEPCRANGQLRSGRSYNGYRLSANGVRVVFGGDTAYTEEFRNLAGGTDLAIMPIGAYGGFPDSHCTPEEALAMADMMHARMILPVHHSTFRLSDEPMTDPLRRLHAARSRSMTRVAITSVGGTYGLT
jgi:L-ascorbate metabolism protein UlaG (beta-lactamase superfamily)